MYKQYAPYKTFLVLADIVVTLLMFVGISALRPYLPGRLVESGEMVALPVIYFLVVILWHLFFVMTGVYDLSRVPSFASKLGRFTSAYFLAVFAFAGLLYFTFRDISRMQVIYFSLSNYAALLLVRYGLTRYLQRKHGGARRARILVVGCTDRGINIAKIIQRQHSSIYEIVGFVRNNGDTPDPMPAPVVGTMPDVTRIVREDEIEIVVIALPEEQARDMEKLIVDLYPLPVRVYLVPGLLKLSLIHSEVENFGELVVVGIREPVIQGPRRTIKRIFDLTASLLILVVTWPLFILIWIAIKLDSPGPAVYRAERVGQNGRIFEMLKFRSMYVGAERHQAEVTTADASGQPIFKITQDPRVTRVGKILRRTSLDELPQLINVVKGEMSLVGPRPEQPFITGTYDYWQWQRLAVPPGITGWWQVSGRSDLPLHLNTQYDLYYVRNFSLLLDLKILLKTILVVIRGEGAY